MGFLSFSDCPIAAKSASSDKSETSDKRSSGIADSRSGDPTCAIMSLSCSGEVGLEEESTVCRTGYCSSGINTN